MKRHSLLLAFALLLLIVTPPTSVGQGSAPHPAAVLSKPYTPTLGDMVALSMSELMTALKGDMDAPSIAIYDREAKKVAVLVYGSKRTIDGAKESLDRMREKMEARSAIVGELYQVTLSTSDFGFVYYNGTKEIVRWEEGKYVVAAE